MFMIKETAELAGVSIRTLQYYDQLGLLAPSQRSAAGYRLYSEDDLALLQQILFFKALDFPLSEIKEIIYSPDFDQEEALIMHRRLLLHKKENINKMLQTIDNTLHHLKGEIKMSAQEKFKGFDFSSNPYEEEARQRWGNKKVDQANAAIQKMSSENKGHFEDRFNGLFKELAQIRHEAPESETAQNKIDAWYCLLNEMGTYSHDAFKGLGNMYSEDERFKANIDQFGEGLAEFMTKAMKIYADKNKA